MARSTIATRTTYNATINIGRLLAECTCGHSATLKAAAPELSAEGGEKLSASKSSSKEPISAPFLRFPGHLIDKAEPPNCKIISGSHEISEIAQNATPKIVGKSTETSPSSEAVVEGTQKLTNESKFEDFGTAAELDEHEDIEVLKTVYGPEPPLEAVIHHKPTVISQSKVISEIAAISSGPSAEPSMKLDDSEAQDVPKKDTEAQDDFIKNVLEDSTREQQSSDSKKGVKSVIGQIRAYLEQLENAL